jgi:hypothetical protein
MPALTNPRHEKFAQELAVAKSATEAYQQAGYKSNYGNSIRLKRNERVVTRVSELQSRGATHAEVTIGSLVAELEDARQLAITQKQASAAVAAIMGKAKITGLITDKSEINSKVELSSNDMELARWIVAKLDLADDQHPSPSGCQSDGASRSGQH